MELKPGVQVRRKSTRDSIGIVCDKPVEIIAGEKYYTISFGNSFQLEKICESDLEIFDGIPSIEELLLSGTYGSKENCFRIITLYKLIKPLRDHIYAIYSSKTAFQPYQFKPVLKYLSSQNRSLLLADEVGLGKTIEAGFIVTEEMARKEIERVLIICPARLRQKWQEEFKRRFNLRMEIKEPNEIVSFFEEFSNRGYPKNLQAVCSLEGLRKREIVENFESSAPPLDFLIVDEAHHLRNSSTLSHRLVRALRDGTDSTLLLTATPVHLTSENFLNLLKILSPQQFTDSSGFQLRLQYNECIVNAQNILYHFSSTNGENILKQCKDALEKLKNVVKEEDLIKNPLYNDIIYRLTIFKNPQPRQIVELQRDLNNLNLFSYIMCRTRKRDVIEKQPKRCPEVVNVNFSVIEEEIYRKIMEYVENKIRISKENKGNIIFGMTMPQRLAASCLPAALEYYQNKIKTEIIDGTDVSPDGITYNYTFDENLYNIQEKLLSLQKHFTKDSKFEALVNKISQIDEIEPGRQIIIFSYFKATLNYLEKELKNRGYNCLVIHGDIPSIPEKPQEDERGKRIKEFRQNPEIKILLSSEVGSEGLDFEFVHIMFNYDLPW
ncbi:MAG TPA: SNF2-related protein, partial [Candidatus Ratteibacteria bacterium]|nr:SNF2-related protein [Candidatus Ratteibacteria bacterium]